MDIILEAVWKYLRLYTINDLFCIMQVVNYMYIYTVHLPLFKLYLRAFAPLLPFFGALLTYPTFLVKVRITLVLISHLMGLSRLFFSVHPTAYSESVQCFLRLLQTLNLSL